MMDDPDRDAKAIDVDRKVRLEERSRNGAWFLGGVVLLVLGALVVVSVVRNVSAHRHVSGISAPETTGSGNFRRGS